MSSKVPSIPVQTPYSSPGSHRTSLETARYCPSENPKERIVWPMEGCSRNGSTITQTDSSASMSTERSVQRTSKSSVAR